jgi:hypothetical protein
MRATAAAGLTALLLAPAVYAQDPKIVAEKQAAELNARRVEGPIARVPLEAPVKGAPYSADIIVAMSQTLADGNHISHSETSHVYRDGEGRTRREQSGTMTVAVAGERVSTRGTITSIVDPVAGYSYSLDAEHKVAWRTPIGTSNVLFDKLQAAGQRSSEPMTEDQKARLAKQKAEMAGALAGSKDDTSPKENAVMRSRGGLVGYAIVADKTPLEHATIDGLAVEGRKTSETIPAGQIGNDLPITITNEEWTSTDLKVLVLTKHTDPRSGESTYRLSNVVRAEPDPSLFMVPAGYDVRDTNIRRNNE